MRWLVLALMVLGSGFAMAQTAVEMTPETIAQSSAAMIVQASISGWADRTLPEGGLLREYTLQTIGGYGEVIPFQIGLKTRAGQAFVERVTLSYGPGAWTPAVFRNFLELARVLSAGCFQATSTDLSNSMSLLFQGAAAILSRGQASGGAGTGRLVGRYSGSSLANGMLDLTLELSTSATPATAGPWKSYCTLGKRPEGPNGSSHWTTV
ncbi:MAG TPA: hypothetical protein VHN99_06550 [Deinococcales bacterium]|nr:hypothetical protein [Deinococcales bacterium]